MKKVLSIVGLLFLLQFSLNCQAFLFKLDSRAVITPESNMYGGFIVSGGEEFVIVVYGPELQNHGVTNFLHDPLVYIVDQTCNTALPPGSSFMECVVAQNNNWKTDSNSDFVQSVGMNPNHDQEAAFYLKIPEGVKSYTFLVTGSENGDYGEAVVAIYRVQKEPDQTVPHYFSAKFDLANSLAISASNIKTVYVEKAFWDSSDLGCPEEGVNHFPFPTVHTGSIIVFYVREYDNFYFYHTDETDPVNNYKFCGKTGK